jgi:hypothetical protein
MARRTRAPDALKRRHLVESELSAPRALAIAESYLADARPFDALTFLSKAGATERLRELLREAAAGGDLFLVREIGALLGEPPSPETWLQVAEAAAAAGKERCAVEARRLAAAAARAGAGGGAP